MHETSRGANIIAWGIVLFAMIGLFGVTYFVIANFIAPAVC